MSEHFVIKNIRRSIAESRSRKEMIVGLPEIRMPASRAEVLLGEIDRLTAELREYKQALAVLSAIWFYGDFRAETWNESYLQNKMEKFRLWPTTEEAVIARAMEWSE